MSILDIDGHHIAISSVDCLMLKEVDSQPGLIVHQQGGETSSCLFPSPEAQDEAWELIRTTLAEEDFYECPNVFFRKDAIVATSKGEDPKDGPYVQISFRGGMTLRRPFAAKQSRDLDFAALEQLLFNRPHKLQ